MILLLPSISQVSEAQVTTVVIAYSYSIFDCLLKTAHIHPLSVYLSYLIHPFLIIFLQYSQDSLNMYCVV